MNLFHLIAHLRYCTVSSTYKLVVQVVQVRTTSLLKTKKKYFGTREFKIYWINNGNLIALVPQINYACSQTSAIKLRLLPQKFFYVPPNCTPKIFIGKLWKKTPNKNSDRGRKKNAARSEIEYNSVVQKYLSLNFFTGKLQKKLKKKTPTVDPKNSFTVKLQKKN